mgnify:CR=1 FL=1
MEALLEQAAKDTHGWKMWVGGEWVESQSGRRQETRNPATGELLARVPWADAQDVDRAVEAAEAAFPAWSAMEIKERGDYIRAFADLVEANADRLGMIDALDSGNPYRPMVADAQKAAGLLRLFAGLGMMMQGQTIPTPGGGLNYTLQQPFGVVARILPYNHPVSFAAGKIAAPLIAGNTVVMKPADQTPLSALLLGKLAEEVFPPGVLNILSGDGAECGAGLVKHPKIWRVAFTGSVETGQRIAADAGIKSLSMELGGKNPLIIYPDVDLDKVVDAAVAGMNLATCQGQSCGSNSRVFVHKDLHKRFVERLTERFAAIRPGLPHLPDTQMGCLVSPAQQQKVLGYIESGIKQGARVMVGGKPPADPELANGCFVEATVFDGVKHGMDIEQNEIFGPVISVLTWSDEEQMIREANGTRYGLCANVWSNDVSTAHRTAARMECGYVWINGHGGRRFAGAPFGGFKESGIGREHSIDELLSYTQIKNVNVRF